MRLYLRTCSNSEVLSQDEQKTLCKRFVEPTLWSQVIFPKRIGIVYMVKRIEETYDALEPLFSKKNKKLVTDPLCFGPVLAVIGSSDKLVFLLGFSLFILICLRFV